MGRQQENQKSNQKMMCGGTTDMKQPDDEARGILESVKPHLLEKANHSGSVELLGYKTQVVAGTNYFMKVALEQRIVHVRIFQPLPFEDKPNEIHSMDDKEHTVDSELL